MRKIISCVAAQDHVMPPICLTDSELAVVLAAARPLCIAERNQFPRDRLIRP
jgi:hypothetical protein